jgi:hypothetical protein
MKVAFYIISFFLIIACNPSNMTCGEIDSKYEKNGEYFLLWFWLVMAVITNQEESMVMSLLKNQYIY